MKNTEIHDELYTIRSLMERSSKFISLSGLSGILAGIYALIGSGAAWIIIYSNPVSGNLSFFEKLDSAIINFLYLCFVALIVLLASISTGIILSVKKAKKQGGSVWNSTSRSLLYNMAVPLVTGGALIIIFMKEGIYSYISPFMLVFYGLSLLVAGNFTYKEIKYLGLSEIILGLITACLPGYGLLFWALGFGVLHIIYGSVMYLKYDR